MVQLLYEGLHPRFLLLALPSEGWEALFEYGSLSGSGCYVFVHLIIMQ